MATAIDQQRQQQQEQLTPQQMMQVASMERAEPETDPYILRMAYQLSWLASQHHASEYNHMKFGPNGSPAAYVPLSIQIPAHARDLRVYQKLNAQKQAWWMASKSTKPVSTVVLKEALNAIGETDSAATGPSELEEALSLAMSSPLPSLSADVLLQSMPKEQTAAPPKTSESHPINMSPMIPYDLLTRLPAYLKKATDGAHPTYLKLPYELTLDCLTAPHQNTALPAAPPSTQEVAPLEKPHIVIPPHVLQSELGNDMPTPPPAPHASPLIPNAPVDACNIPLPPSPEDYTHRPPVPQQPPRLPENGTPPVPPTDQLKNNSSSYFSQPFSSYVTHKHGPNYGSNGTMQPPPLPPLPPSVPRPLDSRTFAINGDATRSTPSGTEKFLYTAPDLYRPSLHPAFFPQTPPLGNLLLSSCPGKKVRLQGPVKGRGTICRDLSRDLARIRNTGVGCIICCLDDSELQFLGAPWDEYVYEAAQLGIDILRLPTPEGFAPLDPTVLNTHLDVVIQRYTLKGISVLVHCRGGVGRAGLIACCWMLKMGLCGWTRNVDGTIHPNSQSKPLPMFPNFNGIQNPPHNGTLQPMATLQQPGLYAGNGQLPLHDDTIIRVDTVDLVARVIRVVRRRRSVKAIETFEQVQFLVQFVEFLRNKGSAVNP